MEIYGFGGELKNGEETSTFFPEEQKSRVSGLTEIRDRLHDLESKVTRGSNWSFSDVLGRFIKQIQLELEKNEFTYRTVIIASPTDITDISEFLALLEEASQLPMTVIFIGMGKKAFPIIKKAIVGTQLLGALKTK